MAIPQRQLDPDLLSALAQAKGITMDDFIATIIIATLTRNNGNRTHTSRELKIPIRSLRYRMRVIESLGYDVPPPGKRLPRNSDTSGLSLFSLSDLKGEDTIGEGSLDLTGDVITEP